VQRARPPIIQEGCARAGQSTSRAGRAKPRSQQFLSTDVLKKCFEEETTLALVKVSVFFLHSRGRDRRRPNVGVADGHGRPLVGAVAVAVGDMVVAKKGGGGRESKSSRNVSFPLSRNLSSFFAPIIQGTKRNPDYSSWQQQSKEEKEGRRKEVGDRAEDDVPCFSTDSVDVPGDTPHVPHETPHNTQGTPHEPQAGSHVPQD
jgi:hypothetical protein